MRTTDILKEILRRQAEITADLEAIRAIDSEFDASLAVIIAENELAARDTRNLLERYQFYADRVDRSEDF